MSAMTIAKIYDFLSSMWGRETAENASSFIDSKINSKLEHFPQIFATKEDLAKLETRMVKWMFIFWISQVGVTFGFILLFLRK